MFSWSEAAVRDHRAAFTIAVPSVFINITQCFHITSCFFPNIGQRSQTPTVVYSAVSVSDVELQEDETNIICCSVCVYIYSCVCACVILCVFLTCQLLVAGRRSEANVRRGELGDDYCGCSSRKACRQTDRQQTDTETGCSRGFSEAEVLVICSVLLSCSSLMKLHYFKKQQHFVTSGTQGCSEGLHQLL